MEYYTFRKLCVLDDYGVMQDYNVNTKKIEKKAIVAGYYYRFDLIAESLFLMKKFRNNSESFVNDELIDDYGEASLLTKISEKEAVKIMLANKEKTITAIIKRDGIKEATI